MAELKIPQKTLQDNFNLQDFKDDFNALNSEIEENKTLTDSEISRLKEIANTWESFRDNGGVINSEVKLPSISLIKNAKKHFTMNVENDGSNNHFAIHSYNENGKRAFWWNECAVVKYHRNFECLINTLIKNKFNILEIKESTASKEAIELIDKYKYQKDRPYFLFMKAQKNN